MKSKLSSHQIELGAMVLAIFNLGQDRLITPLPANEKQLRSAYTKLSNCTTGVHEEHSYWAKQLTKGDKYSIDSVKEHLPWLFG